MNQKPALPRRPCLLTATAASVLLCAASVQAQFQWAERIASSASWPGGEPDTGLALDSNDNCYVNGFFDGANDFGRVTLTDQSIRLTMKTIMTPSSCAQTQ